MELSHQQHQSHSEEINTGAQSAGEAELQPNRSGGKFSFDFTPELSDPA